MGNLLQYQDLIGNGNLGGTPGDCPKGFVCLKNGNCGGRGYFTAFKIYRKYSVITGPDIVLSFSMLSLMPDEFSEGFVNA